MWVNSSLFCLFFYDKLFCSHNDLAFNACLLYLKPHYSERTDEISLKALFSLTFQTSSDCIRIGREYYGMITCTLSKQYASTASFLPDPNRNDAKGAHFWALDPIVACNYL